MTDDRARPPNGNEFGCVPVWSSPVFHPLPPQAGQSAQPSRRHLVRIAKAVLCGCQDPSQWTDHGGSVQSPAVDIGGRAVFIRIGGRRIGVFENQPSRDLRLGAFTVWPWSAFVRMGMRATQSLSEEARVVSDLVAALDRPMPDRSSGGGLSFPADQ